LVLLFVPCLTSLIFFNWGIDPYKYPFVIVCRPQARFSQSLVQIQVMLSAQPVNLKGFAVVIVMGLDMK